MKLKLFSFIFFMSLGISSAFGVWEFSEMKPSSGSWGSKVILTGTDFSSELVKVYYNSKIITPLRITKTSITVEIPENAVTGWFEIEQEGRRLRAPRLFTIKNETVLRQVNPLSGPANVHLKANGYFFTSQTRFYLDYLLLESRIADAKTAVLHIPANARSGQIYYTSLGKKIRSPFRYTVLPLPAVSAVRPTLGWIGDTITITGRNFCKDVRVKSGSVFWEILSKTPTLLRLRLTEGSTNGPVEIHCYGKIIRTPTFTLKPPAGSLVSATPSFGPPGTWVTIKGVSFTPKDRFWLGSSKITSQKYVDKTTFKLLIPAGAVTDIFHHESWGTVNPTSVMFTVAFAPQLMRISPLRGWYGDRITIKGDHFCNHPEVTIGTKSADGIRRRSSTEISFRIPNRASSGKISVSCRGIKAISASNLHIVPPLPQIVDIDPPKGPPGTKILIRGRHFTPGMILLYGRVVLKPVFINSTLMETTINSNKSASFTILTQTKQFKTGKSFNVEYVKPDIFGFYPHMAWHGNTVHISGKSFCAKPTVTLIGSSGSEKLSVLKATSESISVRLPPKAFSGKFEVSCHNMKAVSAKSIDIKIALPAVSGISPSSGPARTWITLSGSGFKRNIQWYLGKTLVRARFVSDSEVMLNAPNLQEKSPVSFRYAGLTINTGFIFTPSYAMPVISTFSRDMGWHGDKLTLTGSNFCSEAKVIFEGGKEGRIFRRIGHSTIETAVPVGAKSGNIKVKCGRSIAVSGEYFTVAPPYSRVISVSKNIACPGDIIEVTGINLTRQTRIFIGDTQVIFTLKSGVKATIRIPAGVRSGDLKVRSFDRTLNTDTSIIIKSRLCKKGR
ncbi:IPT/TIG domain-containing protein [Myxococcota bacterium]|nr:IPT/TIG domain-containing protein [Myxococcota bacterium]MBU1379884.1 IPT/TIG domain-containing protein [Myxococcota bacterium]MBU1498769.1 IPT/TIG domain-containing protein [Myxococcota bacterium]